ncbi:MAG: alkaline phosphatase family protein [Sulfolobales archaeon]
MGDPRSRYAVLAMIALALLASSAMVQTSPIGEEGRKKVIWLSVDSANYYRLYNISYSYPLENLRRVLENGSHGPMVVMYPSATAVNHASESTGAPPGSTGIVGNSIHLPNTSVISTVSGFDGRYLLAEPIWVTADREGLRTIVISYPQSTPLAWQGKIDPSRTKLFNIYDASAAFTPSTLYTTNRSVARATYISFTNASGWAGLEGVGRIYGAWESNISIGDSTWYLLLVDLTGDGYPDKLFITTGSKDVSKALAVLSEGSWSPPINTTIIYRGSEYIVAPMFKAIKLDPSDFRLYRGITRPFNTPWYSDKDLAWAVWNNVISRVGAFTDGDYFALQNDWIDVETYMETVYMTNRFFKEFTIYIIKNTDWDFIITYTPVVDNVYHQFLGMIYPSMPYYDSSKADYYRSLIARAYAMIDEFVGEILRNIDVRTTTLIITSDHGQCPVKYMVNINAILYNAGLISISGGRAALNGTKAWYAGHGHILVNLRGREEGGIVDPSEYRSTVDQIIRAIQAVRDPDTGEPVFDLVVTREQARTLGLWGDRVGDVVIATRCGYTAIGGIPSIREGAAVIFSPAIPLKTLTGDHGTILPGYQELHATFIAYGGGVVKGSLGLISSLSVAPTISEILGIGKPKDSIAPPLPILPRAVVVEVRTATATETIYTTVIKTSTITAVSTSTVTSYTTLYGTVTRQEIKTLTATETKTVEARPQYDISYIAIAAVVALIVGLAIGYIIRGFRR